MTPSLLPTTMTTSLDQLKNTGTTVVSDSGDFACKCLNSTLPRSRSAQLSTAIGAYKPQVKLTPNADLEESY